MLMLMRRRRRGDGSVRCSGGGGLEVVLEFNSVMN